MTVQAEILAKVQEIPPLSAGASKLVTLMGRDDHDLRETVRIIECDAALTARVLKVVNSAGFALIEPTTSIARAVSYLGEKMILGIALDACMGSILRRPLDGYEAESNALWEHNLRTAIAAREVVKFARKTISMDIAFTGGILHDIGKAVLSEFLNGSTREMILKTETGEAADFIAAERQMLGTDHCEVGFEIARLWKLAPPLPEVIRFHHTPGRAEAEVRGLVYAVHLGDIIAMLGGAGTGSDYLKYSIEPGFTDYFQIEDSDLDKIMLDVHVEFQKTRASILGNEQVEE
ncbi:MAG: HDOD domain-containing protein [Syntrophobacteraceae bacterium]